MHILATILPIICVYLIAAFIVMEFDFRNWWIFGRFVYVVIIVFIAAYFNIEKVV